jgi:foldase protein PrsA
MKKVAIAVTLSASILALGACSSDKADSEVVVKSKAGDITKEEFYNELKDRYGEEVLQEMVTTDVLEDKYEVSDKEVDAEVDKVKDQLGDQFDMALQQQGFDDEEAFRKVLRVSLLQEAAVTEGEKVDEDRLKEAYKRKNTEIDASHILVEDEDTAKEVKKKLDDGGDFAKLAKEYSTDKESAKDGGKLGYFSADDMVPEFEDAAYSMKKGEISDPVQSQHGFHIIKVNDKRDKKESIGKYEDVKDDLKREILTKEMDPAKAQEKIQKIMDEAKIDVKIKEYEDLFDNNPFEA